MGAGHHPYPFPFDVGEVVGPEPGSVATGSGNRRRDRAGTGPLGRFGGKAQGRGNPLFHRPFGF